MKTKIISILTQKGGVGKTTTSIHLGASFAYLGKKVLVVDFDGQRNASTGFKIPKDFPYTVKNLLEGNGIFELSEKAKNLLVLAGDKGLEDFLYRNEKDKSDIDIFRLKKVLEILGEQLKFEYIIIDCPPSPITKRISLGKMALIASDFVFSPIKSDEYSIDGIMELVPEIMRIKKEFNPKLEFLGFFFNMVVEQHIDFKSYKEQAKKNAGKYFFESIVRQDMNINHAVKKGETIFQYNSNSRASQDLKFLCKEVIKKIKKYDEQSI